jgi:3-isopropylmalate/(R)-2-methylmalate dehydratase small subunit
MRVHRGLVIPLLRRDIDTDQIIPKQFLKRLERTGFGEYLFHDWRTTEDGSPDPHFILNDPRFAEASILLTGPNFGCGSSREHAAWALRDYGIRAIVAPSFADIFRGNAIANGIVPVAMPQALVTALATKAERGSYFLSVDLERCCVSDGDTIDVAFEIEETARRRLMDGLDDIAVILQHEDAIARYETLQRATAAHSRGFRARVG